MGLAEPCPRVAEGPKGARGARGRWAGLEVTELLAETPQGDQCQQQRRTGPRAESSGSGGATTKAEQGGDQVRGGSASAECWWEEASMCDGHWAVAGRAGQPTGTSREPVRQGRRRTA